MAKQRKGAVPGTLFKANTKLPGVNEWPKTVAYTFPEPVQASVNVGFPPPPTNTMTKADFQVQLQKFIDGGAQAETAVIKDETKTLEERLHWRAEGALSALIKARHATYFMEALNRKNTPQSLARYALRELVSVAANGAPSSSSILAETEAFARMEFYGLLLREVYVYGPIELNVRDD